MSESHAPAGRGSRLRQAAELRTRIVLTACAGTGTGTAAGNVPWLDN